MGGDALDFAVPPLCAGVGLAVLPSTGLRRAVVVMPLEKAGLAGVVLADREAADFSLGSGALFGCGGWALALRLLRRCSFICRASLSFRISLKEASESEYVTVADRARKSG